MSGACNMYEELRKRCGILVGKPGAKRLFGRYRNRCEDNIKMKLKTGHWVWIGLSWLS